MFEDNGQMDWAEANKFRQTQEEMDAIVANQRDFDERMNLVRQGIANREAMSHERDIANSTAFIASDENNGMLPADLRESLSQSLGQQVLGGVNLPDGGYAYLGPSQTEQGKVGIIGKVDALTRLKILQRSNLGDRTVGQQKMLYGMLAKKYTPTQLESAGIHDPNRPYAVGPAIRVGGKGTQQNSINGVLTKDGWRGEDSGARPGYRPRFVSQDDINGTPYKDDNRPGHRYLGGGVSSFSTTQREVDIEDRKRREQQAYEVAMAQAKSKGRSAEDRLRELELLEKGRNERNAANLASKEERQQAYLEERKALREQNERLRKMGLLYGQLGKEYDPKKKAEIQKQIDDLQKGVKDVANPDDNGDPAPAPAPAPTLKDTLDSTGKRVDRTASSSEMNPQLMPGYGLRNDGKTSKGTGYLGELKTADGNVATEYTVGVNIGGKEMDIPTLVPTLTKEEVSQMVNDIIPNKKEVPQAILQKAVDHAKARMADGRSVFANDGKNQDGDTKSLVDKVRDGVTTAMLDVISPETIMLRKR